MRRVRLLVVAVLALALLGVSPALGSGKAGWVHAWTAMPQLTEPHNLPPAPFTQENLVMDDTTLRQTVRVTEGGQQIRLRFSNAFGGTALPITKVAVALPANGQARVAAIRPGSSRPVTFQGRASVTVPIGAPGDLRPADLPGRRRRQPHGDAATWPGARPPPTSPRIRAPGRPRTSWPGTTSPTPTCPGPRPPTTGTSSAASRPPPTPGRSSWSATR